MASAFRQAARAGARLPTATAPRVALARRGVAAGAEDYGPSFIATRRASEAHAAGSSDLWRKISFYVALPLVAVVAVHTWNLEQEHHAHMEALIAENGGEKPERVVYDYMNIRRRSYPWGNQSLFFSPEHNIRVTD